MKFRIYGPPDRSATPCGHRVRRLAQVLARHLERVDQPRDPHRDARDGGAEELGRLVQAAAVAQVDEVLARVVVFDERLAVMQLPDHADTVGWHDLENNVESVQPSASGYKYSDTGLP